MTAGRREPEAPFGWEELHRLICERKSERPVGSGTTRLLDGGVDAIGRRVGELSVATSLAAQRGEPGVFIGELADLLYHLTVLMSVVGVTPEQVNELLRERHEQFEKRKAKTAGRRSATKKTATRRSKKEPTR